MCLLFQSVYLNVINWIKFTLTAMWGTANRGGPSNSATSLVTYHVTGADVRRRYKIMNITTSSSYNSSSSSSSYNSSSSSSSSYSSNSYSSFSSPPLPGRAELFRRPVLRAAWYNRYRHPIYYILGSARRGCVQTMTNGLPYSRVFCREQIFIWW